MINLLLVLILKDFLFMVYNLINIHKKQKVYVNLNKVLFILDIKILYLLIISLKKIKKLLNNILIKNKLLKFNVHQKMY